MIKSEHDARRHHAWGWAAIGLLFCGLCWSLSLKHSRPDRVVVNPTAAETLKARVEDGNRRTEFLSYFSREVVLLKQRENEVSKKLQAVESSERLDCRQRLDRMESEIMAARADGALSERLMRETRKELSSISEELGRAELDL